MTALEFNIYGPNRGLISYTHAYTLTSMKFFKGKKVYRSQICNNYTMLAMQSILAAFLGSINANYSYYSLLE